MRRHSAASGCWPCGTLCPVSRTIVALINEEHFELLVVGFMGHTRLYEQIIGSTSERLVRLAPCAVLVVK